MLFVLRFKPDANHVRFGPIRTSTTSTYNYMHAVGQGDVIWQLRARARI